MHFLTRNQFFRHRSKQNTQEAVFETPTERPLSFLNEENDTRNRYKNEFCTYTAMFKRWLFSDFKKSCLWKLLWKRICIFVWIINFTFQNRHVLFTKNVPIRCFRSIWSLHDARSQSGLLNKRKIVKKNILGSPSDFARSPFGFLQLLLKMIHPMHHFGSFCQISTHRISQ